MRLASRYSKVEVNLILKILKLGKCLLRHVCATSLRQQKISLRYYPTTMWLRFSMSSVMWCMLFVLKQSTPNLAAQGLRETLSKLLRKCLKTSSGRNLYCSNYLLTTKLENLFLMSSVTSLQPLKKSMLACTTWDRSSWVLSIRQSTVQMNKKRNK